MEVINFLVDEDAWIGIVTLGFIALINVFNVSFVKDLFVDTDSISISFCAQ